MKGFGILDKGKTGWVEIKKPVAGPLDAVIRMTAVSPCTSDVHIVDNLPPEYAHIKGCVLGHEGIGIIEEVGSQVKDFKPGDRVVIPGMIINWRTLMVQAGLSQYDPSSSYPQRLEEVGGTFAEYCLVYDADMNLAIIPPSVTDTQAIMVPDMIATAFTAVSESNIMLGDTVAVLGIGPVGLMSICGALLRGASRVFAIGSRKACFDVATQYGATDLINYKDGDVAQQILEKNNGKPVDVVLVSGGTSDAIGTALKMVKFGGTIANVALFWGEENTVIPNIDWGFGACHFKTITGTMLQGGRYYMEKLISLVEYGRIKPELMASHVFHGFDKIEDSYITMSVKSPDLIKPVVLIG